MGILFKYFTEYVNNFINSNIEEEKQLCAQNIIRIINFIEYLEKNKYTKIFQKSYKNIKNNPNFNHYIVSTKDKNNYKEEEQFSIEEFKYIKDIIKYIKTNYSVKYKLTKDTSLLSNYMGNDNYQTYKNKFNIIISEYTESCCFKLTDKNLIFLEKLDMTTLLHEFIHLNSYNIKYTEFPSILAELSFCSYYKLGDPAYRLMNIENTNKISIKNFNKYDRNYYIEDLIYCLGALLSVGFIYQNGNSFKNVEEVIKIINNYQNYDIFYIMKKLNINDNDIINGFKNYRKILTKGEIKC